MHKRVYNQLRAVTYIGDERSGPRGGRYRLLDLECGHVKAWAAWQPKGLGWLVAKKIRLVPQRVRCLLCGPKPVVDSRP